MEPQKIITFPTPESQPEPSPPASRFADARAFGDFLRKHREGRKISLQQIATRTKVMAARFEGLERGEIRGWPSGIYRRGMIRAYASAIGLEPDEILRDFEILYPEFEPIIPISEQKLQPAVPQPARSTLPATPDVSSAAARFPRSIAAVALGVVVGAAAATLILWSSPSRESTPTEQEIAPAAETSAVPHAAPSDDTPTAATAGAGEPTPQTDVVPAARVETTLTVTSDPPGARVTVDGVGWGSTPITIRYLESGSKRIRVSKEGFVSAETTVLLGGRPAAAQLSLQPLDAPR